MKQKLPKKISASKLKNPVVAVDLMQNIRNLTVEDVVVTYAYAEAIVETVREPLVIIDGDLKIKTANKSFFEMFKVSKHETYNKYFYEIGNGQWDIPPLKKLLSKILHHNSNFSDYKVEHDFHGIGKKTMLLNARRIVLEGHKTELILLAIEDITERSLIDKQKDDFIGIVSHELKTPLTSAKAFVQILQMHNKKTKDQKNTELLNKVLVQLNRMDTFMASFLSAYTLQTGKIQLHKTHFNLDHLIQNIIETIHTTNKSHQIEFEDRNTKTVLADKERVAQVLTNLLTNAIRYSPHAHKVNVSFAVSPTDIRISIQDYGKGIPKEQQRIIFDRFYRVKIKEDESVNGLGLGLYIAHEIVMAHKGKMWVESTLGKGSTFYFTLPLKKSTSKKA
jgi:signal transduction histidine kinase